MEGILDSAMEAATPAHATNKCAFRLLPVSRSSRIRVAEVAVVPKGRRTRLVKVLPMQRPTGAEAASSRIRSERRTGNHQSQRMPPKDIPSQTEDDVREEYFESRATGVELEVEDGSQPEDPEPWDPEKIRIQTKHYSLRNMVDMIADGDVDLAPDFQRHYVWKARQRSGLIESLLLGIPLPSFYFNEDKKGRLQVVDGVQRLTTIFRYVGEQSIKLGKVTYLQDLEGQSFDDLAALFRRRPVRLAVRRPCNRPTDSVPREVRRFPSDQHRRKSAEPPGDSTLHERDPVARVPEGVGKRAKLQYRYGRSSAEPSANGRPGGGAEVCRLPPVYGG